MPSTAIGSALSASRMGRPGTFVTLDGQERTMLADDLLIWDENEPVALAGIMGGLQSEVRDSTTHLLLESANFKASRIRRTSVRLDLRTESAQRFEKSQPPVNVRNGIARILQLIQDSGADPRVVSRFTVEGDLKDHYRPLELSRRALWAMAGQEIPDREVLTILQSLGFEAEFRTEIVADRPDEALVLGIPPHRSEKDLSIPADLVEEVLRVYGYGRIEPRMPEVPIKPLHVETTLRMEHKARRLLAQGHRFLEVQNYGWFDDHWLRELGFQPARPLELRNPSAQQNRLLRTTLVPNLLALVRPNRVHRDAFRLFEIGRVYSARGDSGPNGSTCAEAAAVDSTPVERNRLAGVSFNQANQPPLEEQFRAIKGAIEDLAAMTGSGPYTFEPCAAGAAPWEVAGHWVAVRGRERTLGGLGVLAGPILETVAQEGQVVWFELDLEELEGTIFPELKYSAPPIYPGSWQDFSLVWDLGKGFAALEERLEGFSHPLVMRREFLTVYKGKGLLPGKGSYSFRYWIGAWDHTLSSEEIEQFRTAFLGFLDSEGMPLR